FRSCQTPREGITKRRAHRFSDQVLPTRCWTFGKVPPSLSAGKFRRVRTTSKSTRAENFVKVICVSRGRVADAVVRVLGQLVRTRRSLGHAETLGRILTHREQSSQSVQLETMSGWVGA